MGLFSDLRDRLFYQKEHANHRNTNPGEQTPLLEDVPGRIALTDPSSSRLTIRHWVVLMLACLLLFGNYYCYELPAALNIQLREWLQVDYDKWQYQLNLLFTLASLPNVLVPLFGGIAMDRIGSVGMMCVFTFATVVGQALFALGVSVKSIPLIFAGRLVFGMGGGSLEVAQAKVTTDWFRSHALAFALGLNLTFARIPTAANYNITPWIYRHFGENPTVPIWFGFLLCLGSAACMVMLIYLDRPESRRRAGVKVDRDENGTRGRTEEGVVVDAGDGHGDEEKIDLKQIWELKQSFWILCAVIVVLYGAVQPFFHMSQDFLQSKWFPNQPQRAGAVQSIPDIISSIGSPIFGYLIDRHGRRGTMLPIAAAVMALSHVTLAFTDLHPAVALFWLGMAYTLFASVVWPCVSLVVRERELGTAYGIGTVALNITLTLVPLIVGWIRARSNDFVAVEVFFALLASSGVAFGIWLWFVDRADGGVLEKIHMVGVKEDEVVVDTTDVWRR